MTRRLTYRPAALADLEAIAGHTRREWGEAQAKRYVGALVNDIKALRTSAERYPLFELAHPGLRRKRSAMHHIYFSASDRSVEIVRIIHVQRDPGRLLSADRGSP
jgi:toxin ParE1/3/4